MMEIYGHLLGLLFGAMLTFWSVWMLWIHFRATPGQKARRRIRPWIPGILLIIGLADLTKALRDLWKDF